MMKMKEDDDGWLVGTNAKAAQNESKWMLENVNPQDRDEFAKYYDLVFKIDSDQNTSSRIELVRKAISIAATEVACQVVVVIHRLLSRFPTTELSSPCRFSRAPHLIR